MNIYDTQIYFLATTVSCSLSTSNEYTSCARVFRSFLWCLWYCVVQCNGFFFSHRRRVINPKRLCFLKTFDSDISLRSITLSATAIKVYCVRPCLHGFGQISERTRTRDPRNRASFWVLQSITVFARFRVNELHRSKICPDPRDLSVLRIWSTNSL